MNRPTFIRSTLLSSLLLAGWISAAGAYENYSTNGLTGNCATCHGDFLSSPYVSMADGANWGDDLHDVHRNTMLNGDCNACHSSGGRSPVSLLSSVGGAGFDPISCLGCHGRPDGGGTVTGAGLRQHHWNSGVTGCLDCHADSNPAALTPPGENVMPPYYFTPDAAHPGKPTDPCNPNGEEDFAGTFIGLDNDGDGLYDQNDSDCQVSTPVPDINLSPGRLNFGEVPPGGSATLQTAIQNLGTADLEVTLIDFCAGTSPEFSWIPDTPFTVVPGSSQILEVTYSPADEGIDTGCLAISSNDPDEAVKQLGLNLTSSSILRFLPVFVRPAQSGTE